jgi:hypothetical protein
VKEPAIDNHHFAVEVLKSAQTQIAVLSQRSDSHSALVNALDERGGGGDLIQGVVRHLEVRRERPVDYVRDRLLRPTGVLHQRPPQAR